MLDAGSRASRIRGVLGEERLREGNGHAPGCEERAAVLQPCIAQLSPFPDVPLLKVPLVVHYFHWRESFRIVHGTGVEEFVEDLRHAGVDLVVAE
eukprot:8525337-Heterocapsa_arctica.AAC.1